MLKYCSRHWIGLAHFVTNPQWGKRVYFNQLQDERQKVLRVTIKSQKHVTNSWFFFQPLQQTKGIFYIQQHCNYGDLKLFFWLNSTMENNNFQVLSKTELLTCRWWWSRWWNSICVSGSRSQFQCGTVPPCVFWPGWHEPSSAGQGCGRSHCSRASGLAREPAGSVWCYRPRRGRHCRIECGKKHTQEQQKKKKNGQEQYLYYFSQSFKPKLCWALPRTNWHN